MFKSYRRDFVHTYTVPTYFRDEEIRSKEGSTLNGEGGGEGGCDMDVS